MYWVHFNSTLIRKLLYSNTIILSKNHLNFWTISTRDEWTFLFFFAGRGLDSASFSVVTGDWKCRLFLFILISKKKEKRSSYGKKYMNHLVETLIEVVKALWTGVFVSHMQLTLESLNNTRKLLIKRIREIA